MPESTQTTPPAQSELQPLIYDWGIMLRRLVLPVVISWILLGLGRAGVVGPEAQAIASQIGEAVTLAVVLAASRADWLKYIKGIGGQK